MSPSSDDSSRQQQEPPQQQDPGAESLRTGAAREKVRLKQQQLRDEQLLREQRQKLQETHPFDLMEKRAAGVVPVLKTKPAYIVLTCVC